MYKQIHIITLFFIFLMAGCGTTKDTPAGSIFSFQVDGNSYQIIGYTASWGESANILLQLQDDQPVLRAIDYDRNGSLDVLVYGERSIEEANLIYRQGIAQALRKSMIKQEKSPGEFELETDDFIFVVESFREEHNGYVNRFFIYYKNWNTAGMYRDNGSNGILDRAEKGGISLEEAQRHYEMVLEKAGEQNRLENRDDNKFIILQRHVTLNQLSITFPRFKAQL